MYSRYYSPLPVLKDFVKYYIILDTIIEDFNQFTQCTIPNYCPFLILSISDNAPTFVVEDRRVHDVSEHIGGQISSPVYIDKPGNFRIAVVLFQANGAYHLFRNPQIDYLDRIITLQDLLGSKAGKIREKIINKKASNNEIVRELDFFLLGFLKNNDIRKSYVDYVLSQTMEKNGSFKIEPLYTDLNINPRTFRRNFRRQVGVSPKEYLRVLRLNRLHKYLMSNKKNSIHDLVYQLGYYDQAHLINDFKKYARYAPGSLTYNAVVKHFMKADSFFEKSLE